MKNLLEYNSFIFGAITLLASFIISWMWGRNKAHYYQKISFMNSTLFIYILLSISLLIQDFWPKLYKLLGLGCFLAFLFVIFLLIFFLQKLSYINYNKKLKNTNL